ncbi:MAG: hypothetical protein Fues2KO_06890 [Fuerstiella sp.]
MTSKTTFLTAVLCLLPATVLLSDQQSDGLADEKADTISKIMRHAMTKGLCRKAVRGDASMDEKKKLLSLFRDLESMKPPRGSEESWKKLTGALTRSANDLVAGKDARDALKKAANCTACHKHHRP